MKKRADSYVFTADPMSSSDMQQIVMVKKTVSAMNKAALTTWGYQKRNAEYFGQPVPAKPKLSRVRLMGRGPRKAAHIQNLREGGYAVSGEYQAYLPQRFAKSFDVYIARA